MKDFMNEAIKEAKKAYEKEEVPIGAVIVKDGNIISRAHNLRETKKQATAHAEILAIEKACKKLDTWRLENCDMYVTLEPCVMCAGAIINARIKNLYIGTLENENNKTPFISEIFDKMRMNHKVNIFYSELSNECSTIIKDFFKKLRNGEKYKK